jgi:hypothetical protein
MALPRPLLAPVITATFPFRLYSIICSFQRTRQGRELSISFWSRWRCGLGLVDQIVDSCFSKIIHRVRRLSGSLALLWCVSNYRKRVSDFSSFVEQRSCRNLFRLEVERGLHTLVSVSSWCSVVRSSSGQGSLLFGMSGVTAHDARYASLKRNERAQSTNGQRAPRASTGARRSKVQSSVKVGLSLGSSYPGLASSKRPALGTVPLEPGFGAEPQVHPRKVSGHF